MESIELLNSLFCFNLRFNEVLKVYLPEVYILDETYVDDFKFYLDKKISVENLKGNNIVLSDLSKGLQKIISVCDNLSVNTIFKKFSKNSKSAKTINDLLIDSKLEYGIRHSISVNLLLFYQLIREENLLLSVDNKKDTFLIDSKVELEKSLTKVKLKFVKTEDGLTYTLFLNLNGTFIYPSDYSLKILSNEPAFILFETQVLQLENFNSNKITPFLKKKSIDVPAKMVGDYFNKFIKDVAKKVEIEAEGFEVEKRNKIVCCSIEIVHDFIKKNYYINLRFDYDGFIFEKRDQRDRTAFVELDDKTSEIKLIQFIRDIPNENLFENQLFNLNFVKSSNLYYSRTSTENESDTFETIQWIIDNQEKLENLDFKLDNLGFEGKPLRVNKSIVKISSNQINDWFDVQMSIHCGDFSFNFIEIIPNLISNNRIYNLPDGTCFLIPFEWMTAYSSLVKFATIKDGKLHLPKSNFTILEDIPEYVKEVNVKSEEVKYLKSSLLKADLRPYQINGVKWLLEHYNNGLGACLADDMGLGKTLQTLTFLNCVKEQSEVKAISNVQLDLFQETETISSPFLKALIVLPSSLIYNWKDESNKFVPHFKCIQYVGSDRNSLLKTIEENDLIFTSYSIISRDIEQLIKHDFNFVVLDESQYIKNKNSKIFKSINQINAKQKISLSGTPIENSLDDLWSQMQFINPNILGSYNFFQDNFKKPIEKLKDESCIEELKKCIQPFILRRTKEQVLTELPPLLEQVVYCEMEDKQEKLYEQEKSKARNFLLLKDEIKVDNITIVNTLLRLRQISNHPKLIDESSDLESGKYKVVTNYLETLVKSGSKSIIFSSFVSNLEFYKKWCNENKIQFCEITGSTSLKERELEINRFQEKEEPLLFFISLKAGGVGLNITKASYVLFLDPWWNPFIEKQAIGRTHRMGQLNKVNVVRFITKNTIEEKILKLQESKKDISDSLLDENYIFSEVSKNLSFVLE